MKRPPIFVLVLLAGIAAETLLSLRLWAQVTARPIDTEELRLLFAITQELAAPFVLVTHEEPMRTSGIVDFTVLVAIEGYLIGTLALLAICFTINRSISLFSRHGRRARGVRALPLGPFLQSVAPPSSPALTYYLSVRLQPARGHGRRAS